MKSVRTAIVIVSLLYVPTLTAQPAFGTKVNFGTGSLSQPFAVAMGDLNGDGKLDMVSANAGTGGVSVFMNTTAPGAATATFDSRTDVATGGGTNSVALVDLNGDGKLDIVATNTYSSNISVLLNSTTFGSSVFTSHAKVDFGTDSAPRSLAIADFNMDGRPDVALIDSYMSLFLNTTPFDATVPTFSSRQSITTGSGSSQLSAADVNGDGKPDVAVSNYGNSSKNVTILINTTSVGASSASFSDPNDFVPGNGRIPEGVALGDLNCDGKPDLAVTLRTDTLLVYFNTTPAGDAIPTFTAWSAFQTDMDPYSIIIGDVNMDGKNDVVVTNDSAFSASVFLNDAAPGASTPAFFTRSDFIFSNNPYVSALGDLNGDGLPDLAVPSYRITDYVAVRFNTTNTAASSPSFSAQTGVGSQFADAPAIGDLNGDAKPDLVIGRIISGISPRFTVQFNTTAVGSSSLTFSDTSLYRLNNNPEGYSIGSMSSAIADMNGDGKRDILLTDGFSTVDSISIYLNNTAVGASLPSLSSRIAIAAGEYPGALIAEEMNNDGKPDMVFTDGVDVYVMINTTVWGSNTLSFGTRTGFAVGDTPFSIAAGDVNGDGKKDLIVTNYSPETVSVLLNTTVSGSSTPSFAAAFTFAVGAYPSGAFLADFTMDGKPDIVVTQTGDDNVAIYPNTTAAGAATPSFSAAVLVSTGNDPINAAAADMNGDGKVDLLVTVPTNIVSVFQNTSTGSTPEFASASDFTIGFYSYTILPADMNMDGKRDVITSGETNSLAIALNSVVITLPVELVSFTAAAAGLSAELKWSTAAEKNNYGFEIERKELNHRIIGSLNQSTDEAMDQWKAVSFIEGHGTTNAPKEYSFHDKNLKPGEYLYRLKQVDHDGAFNYSPQVEVTVGNAPKEFRLEQNYPNPFNPSTNMEFTVPATGRATLRVYNLVGQEVATLFDGIAEAGQYQHVTFNAAHLASGIYFAQLQSGGSLRRKKMMFVK